MNSMSSGEPPKYGKGPKTRVCYICGRQYGLSSYEIHLKQCKELWVARESLKPPKERKELPKDPTLELSGGISSLEGSATRQLTLEETNALAEKTFNEVALLQCPYCGRTFLAEKLPIHNRSCTADKPARRVDESVRRGLPPANTTAIESGSAAKVHSNERARPSTSGTLRERIRKHVDASPSHELPEVHTTPTTISGDYSHGSTQDVHESSEERVSALQRRVDSLEKTVFSLVESIEEMKSEIRELKSGR